MQNKHLKKLIALVSFWRITLCVPLIVGFIYLPGRNGYDYTFFYNSLKFQQYTLSSLLFTSFANFDGVHYLSIARNSYTVEAGFFPLYPILVRVLATALSLFFHIRFYVLLLTVGLLISTVACIGGLYLLHKLLRLEYTEQTVFETILYLIVFPVSFFFMSAYAESLFFFLSVLILYLCRKKKWWLAALAALFLTATRPVGIAIISAIIWELFLHEKTSVKELFIQSKKHVHFFLKACVLSAISSLGLISYMVFNFLKWHDILYFVHAQGEFKNNRSVSSVVFFPQTIVRYIKILLSLSPHQYEWHVALLEFSSFFFAAILLFIAWRKKVRTSYLIFSVFAFLIPISTGTFSGLPRYVMVLFPAFLALALIKQPIVKIAYVIVSTALLFYFFLFFSQGYFVA